MPVRDEPVSADIGIDTRTLAYIVLKAKAYDALVAADDPSDGSNAADDRMLDALEDEPDTAVAQDLRAAIRSLNIDQQTALVALAWLGRDDYDADEWDEACAEAHAARDTPAARYLMGLPLLGDYLEGGADKLAISLTDDEIEVLQTPDAGGPER